MLGNELNSNSAKNQILEMYLNRVPYGNHAIGVETAAELYFLKPAKDLDLAEAAMLAGPSAIAHHARTPCSTTATTPNAKDRQRVVLGAMVSNGDITQAQANAAISREAELPRLVGERTRTLPERQQ